MADHSKPTNTSLYTDYTSEIDARFDDLTLGLDPAVTSPTNVPTNAIRWNSASAKWEKWNGTAWADLASAYNINLAGPITLTANTASDAFRITQTGSGNAFVVEDSASPDSTPTVVNANGSVVIGYTVPINVLGEAGTYHEPSITTVGIGTLNRPVAVTQWSSNLSRFPQISFAKSASNTIGTFSAVANAAGLGRISFDGDDGSNFIRAAEIICQVDGTPGTNDMPGRLVFSTTADGASSPMERLRIGNSGNIGHGVTGTNSVGYYLGRNHSGATETTGIRIDGAIQSDVTGYYIGFYSRPNTQATAFTLTNIRHFYANPLTTFGAGSTVTNQVGYYASGTLVGATNNYGFYSDIASATGRWNFYANGTAPNYFAGQTFIGNPTTIGLGVSYPLQISSTGDSGQLISQWSNNTLTNTLTFVKSRGGSIGTKGIVQNNDVLGRLSFRADDGAATNFLTSSEIKAEIDGVPNLNDVPGRLVFSTTADGASTPTERTRIGADGTLRHLNDIAFNNATVLTASYDGVSKSIITEEISPNKIWFRPDGLRMYILGAAGDDITQYTLTTAWDITTAGTPVTFSIAAQENGPQGLYFREDGLKFYIVGTTNDTVYQYSCGTAWDITTSSYDSKSFSVTAQEASPYGLFFKPNGLKMYVTGNTSDTIFEYDLGTAWDVSTAVYNSISVSVTGFDTNPLDIKFTNDGYKLFMLGNSGDDITEFALSKAWDITTIQRLGEFSVASQDTTPVGLYFKPDLSKFYMVGTTLDVVYQYSMGAGSINLTSDVKVNGKFNVIGTPPAAATSTGKKGDIIWDSGYIYICVADNTWKRSAITTW